MDSIRCFVSFCLADKPEWMVKKFLDHVEERADKRVEFDVYYEKSLGYSLREFMDENLASSDVVLLMLGPEYKARIDNAVVESGVFQEYETLVAVLEGTDSYKKPYIIPVIWKGENPEDCMPSYFATQAPIAAIFNQYLPVRDRAGKVITPKADSWSAKIDKLIASILSSQDVNGPIFIRKYRNNLQQMLTSSSESLAEDNLNIDNLLRHKFEHTQFDKPFFYDNLFTKTKFFREVDGKNVTLIKGRKGSGKTTLVQMMELKLEDSNYFQPIDIEVDEWNLHYIFDSNIYRQTQGDFRYVDIDAKLFDFAWPIFVALSMMASAIGDEVDSRSGVYYINDDQFNETFVSVVRAGSESKNFYSQIFLISIDAVHKYIQKIVDNASADSEISFKVEVSQKIHIGEILDHYFGRNFDNINRLENTKKASKYVLSIDRFDTEFQRYRKDNIERDNEAKKTRSKREVDWLSSLIHFVEKVTTPHNEGAEANYYRYFSKVHFIVVLPYDRVEEIRAHQRDSIAGEQIHELYWQPKELLTMLRKRIELLYNVDTKEMRLSNKTPRQRYNYVINQTPLREWGEGYLNHSGKRWLMDLFLIVLRHSFFRPRDVLVYYAAILAYLNTVGERGDRAKLEVIHDIVSRETRTIVNLEFINELKDSWTNIEDVLNKFRGGDQIYSYRQLESLIGTMDFKFFRDSSNISKMGAKLTFLYEVGFIGYKNKREVGSSASQKDFNFVMFDRMVPAFSVVSVCEKLDFAIHPIFIESLFLTPNGGEPVMRLDWDLIDRWDR